MEMINLTLNWILLELRMGTVMKDYLAQVLFGFASETFKGNWDPRDKKIPGAPRDSFDAILSVLNSSSMFP